MRKNQGAEALLGVLVTVTVDRPMGSRHPAYADLCYPINYGYINGVMAGDGEEQDAYLVGIDEPVTEGVGRVIAVIHRLHDVEDKLVVAPDGILFSREEILSLTAFQERYFEIELVML